MPESNYIQAIVYRGTRSKTYGQGNITEFIVVKLSPAEHGILIYIFRKEESRKELNLLHLAHLFKP